ncbi:MAG TPA: SpoIIE family protein phosphatase [Draconibacterium sp.]|nr:SpoIIE family protein phosphatase [Draconibacterium sp.]
MINKSLAYRLSIYISLAVIAVFIAFISIYILFNVEIVKENIQNKTSKIGNEVENKVNKYIQNIVEVTETISEQIVFYDQYGHVQPFLEQFITKYPFINAIHIDLKSTIDAQYHNFLCFNAGDSIIFNRQNTPIATCVTKHPEYQKLITQKVSSWSEPLVCTKSNSVVVSYFSPIILSEEDSLKRNIGEVICDLSLKELDYLINQIKIGENGYAFLISKDGTYISHPRKEWILERSIFDVPQKVLKRNSTELQKFLSNPHTGSIIAKPEMLNNEKSWVYYTQLQNGWILFIVVPFKEMFEPLFLPILKMLFFSVLGILVIYILITYITNRQIQPLSELTSQLEYLSSLSGEKYTGEETMNEITHVSQSLSLLKNWYEKNKIKVSREEKLNKLKDNDIFQAAEIQQSLIKFDYPAFPNNPEIDLFTSYKPARVVSGDLFDYFFLDQDHIVITIGDVSGKGVPAAFFMSVAQTVIKSVSVDINTTESSRLVERINEELYSNNVHQFFLTLFLGILNIRTGELSYCNAAHTASFVLKGDGVVDILSDTHGLPLGLYRGKGYGQASYKLTKGDSLILYTDGVTELQDENGEHYGSNRFKENLLSLKGLSPKEMVYRIEASLQQFMGSTVQTDDICILILRYDE